MSIVLIYIKGIFYIWYHKSNKRYAMIIKTTILEFFPPYSSFTEIIMACLPLWSYFKNKNKQKKTEKKNTNLGTEFPFSKIRWINGAERGSGLAILNARMDFLWERKTLLGKFHCVSLSCFSQTLALQSMLYAMTFLACELNAEHWPTCK